MPRASLASLLLAATALAQAGPVNGPRRIEPRYDALLHATVIPAPGERVDDATLVLRDGLVVSLQSGAPAPAGARTHDLRGRWICAGFVDAHVPVDAPPVDASGSGAHWNPRVTPQRSALDGKGLEPKLRDELRKLGFTAAMLAPRGGVFRGHTAVVLLDEPGEAEGVDRTAVVARGVFAEVGYETAEREYPASPMGVIALIRQTLLDAQWFDAAQRALQAGAVPREPLLDAAALRALGPKPRLLFDCRHELDALSACRIAGERGLGFALVGCGTEFRRLPALTANQPAVIVPLAFPVEPPVRALADSEAIALRELMTWEQAPTNPRRLANAGLTVALTSDKLESRAQFGKNLKKALQHGLTAAQALAMLTVNPARILGLEAQLGALVPGRLANLAVFDAEPFAEDARLRALWIRGRQVEIDAAPAAALAGQWRIAAALPTPLAATATITSKNEIQFAKETKLEASDVRINESHVQWTLRQDGTEGRLRLSGIADGGRIVGRGVTTTGEPFTWSAERTGDVPPVTKDAAKVQPPPPESLPVPFGPYGMPAEPEREDVVVVHATLWTSGAAGTIEDGVLAVVGGKVAYAGPKDRAPAFPDARVIDARGKHVTPGLIDCHSHTGVHGPVNEGTQSCTAEVRISDVIDPDDVGWYRELAGGLTTVNQLHGSANPIGGQNSVVKLRWGVAEPVQMRLEGAEPGIKFALGENVKQSNREGPDRRSIPRYPQTRMGVETFLRDRFVAARDHAAALARFAALGEAERARTVPPRPDLELDALAEILAGRRLVHCHSYRQDEILMLARLGQSFAFRIGTYQHVLEGYKVADAVAASALGASAFSDWWAYKFEVYDAIPDNGAIMHAAGVCVSFNSDSDEMARRMNVEAAKAVKYGNLPPADALQFVTQNPAKQLRVDDRIGSLEAGKDGDFVIWSGDPLSPRSLCEATWIEGRERFSLARDRELRAWNARERARIVQKVLASKPEAKDEGKDEKKELTPIAEKPLGEDQAAEVERLHRRHLVEQLRSGRRCACAFPQEDER